MQPIFTAAILVVLFSLSLAAQWQLNVNQTEGSFNALLDGIKVLQHNAKNPCLLVGKGRTTFTEHHGNFDVSDYIEQRIPLHKLQYDSQKPNEISLKNSDCSDATAITLQFKDSQSLAEIISTDLPDSYDRVWIRFVAEPNDMIFGAGEQFTYFNLRGKEFPIWTREQGVGRNKSTLITFESDVQGGGAGGDYHTTYYGQPTFFSTGGYLVHMTATEYTTLDFTQSLYHEVQVQGNLRSVQLASCADKTIKCLSSEFVKTSGRMPPLPEWVYSGAILGVQGGTQKMMDYLKQADDHDVHVSALWIQDWAGRIKTSFGSRVFWNWEWNRKHYPDLDKKIIELKKRGVRVVTYINPYLNDKGDLFKEADRNGYFVKNKENKTRIADFGEFYCGTLDLTYPDAVEWYKERIIKPAIRLGISGWMADFSEYLMVEDAVFHSGESAAELHNKWPTLWAKLNREAVEEEGKMGEVVFWMRAGYSGVSNYTTLMWAGDQNVDYSRSDGLPSTIPAALSMGLQGIGYTHFDIGGYTSLFGVTRTKELLLRSAEAAVFTPVMRTHEGNRPTQNWQVYSDSDTWDQFGRLVKIYLKLVNYTKTAQQQYLDTGVPLQRALIYTYPDDATSHSTEYQYMYGDDLLVAPVLKPNVSDWDVYLPPGDWIHLWSNKQYAGKAKYTVKAPIGQPPVFYKKGSKYPWADLRIPLVVPQTTNGYYGYYKQLPNVVLALLGGSVFFTLLNFIY